MDYQAYLTRLAELPLDTPCFCEHLTEERDCALNIARQHRIAEVAGCGSREEPKPDYQLRFFQRG